MGADINHLDVHAGAFNDAVDLDAGSNADFVEGPNIDPVALDVDDDQPEHDNVPAEVFEEIPEPHAWTSKTC